jgi:hypothetical protein
MSDLNRKHLFGNLYWTNKGFAMRVDSPEKARLYNKILIGSCFTVLIAITVALVYFTR